MFFPFSLFASLSPFGFWAGAWNAFFSPLALHMPFKKYKAREVVWVMARKWLLALIFFFFLIFVTWKIPLTLRIILVWKMVHADWEVVLAASFGFGLSGAFYLCSEEVLGGPQPHPPKQVSCSLCSTLLPLFSTSLFLGSCSFFFF